ncbi:hypothetical protein Meth11DRAFT_0408 [Methylophilaceae bacterium 11]|uniref:hypothetical protein n=1 Tax=Methylotenera sp. 1P/1 TaxID=1131551 RepID=UPI00035F2A27|nr:hypothetical protein [Methylotenera sp. 1P/1]EUJ09609.1 hypothetical protein Meth11DRAFT_0408 [Methylophilaceae bacterium 11]
MWKKIRIIILLLILATVIQQTLQEDADLDWNKNFYVAVYPINADNSAVVSTYINTLTPQDFEPVAEYFAEEAQRYQLGLRRPFEIRLGDKINQIPPAPPVESGVLKVVLWSLQFRYFAWKNSPSMSVKPDIRLYLLYHDPLTSPRLTHSTALNKGRIGRVNLFADAAYAKKNLVILAHELLHTVKATDKYDLANGLPSFPDGYAEPEKQPRLPQDYAELMGGRVPLTESTAEVPKSLRLTLIGRKTAREIGWVR